MDAASLYHFHSPLAEAKMALLGAALNYRCRIDMHCRERGLARGLRRV